MKVKSASFSEELNYIEERVVTKVILETQLSKEIRILLKAGQIMKEHKAAYPIVLHIIEGAINFGVDGELKSLKKGDIVSLEANTPHDLTAIENSIVRLTLSKNDKASRLNRVIDKA